MPDTNFSLINLNALSKPACKLIDAVRSAVGILYEPTQIRRRARADAEANVILARNQQEIEDIEIRASERLRDREMRRQENIENVTRTAIGALPDAVTNGPVNEDWVHEFYEHCQDVGNEQMQRLWGKILAGEVAKPGSFSLRCLRLVKDIQQKDADLFTRFCTFAWHAPIGLAPVIPVLRDQTIKDAGINFMDFLHLVDLGLIQFNPTQGFAIHNSKGKTYVFTYYGLQHHVSVPDTSDGFHLSHALFTSVGEELAPLSGAHPSEAYRRSVVDDWRCRNYLVKEPPGSTGA